MLGWHHRLNGHEFEQTPGDGEGQGSLARCSPWGHKESDTTELLNNNKVLKLQCQGFPLENLTEHFCCVCKREQLSKNSGSGISLYYYLAISNCVSLKKKILYSYTILSRLIQGQRSFLKNIKYRGDFFASLHHSTFSIQTVPLVIIII